MKVNYVMYAQLKYVTLVFICYGLILNILGTIYIFYTPAVFNLSVVEGRGADVTFVVHDVIVRRFRKVTCRRAILVVSHISLTSVSQFDFFLVVDN